MKKGLGKTEAFLHFSLFIFHFSLKEHLLPSYYIDARMGDVVDALSLEVVDRGIGWSGGDGREVY